MLSAFGISLVLWILQHENGVRLFYGKNLFLFSNWYISDIINVWLILEWMILYKAWFKITNRFIHIATATLVYIKFHVHFHQCIVRDTFYERVNQTRHQSIVSFTTRLSKFRGWKHPIFSVNILSQIEEKVA